MTARTLALALSLSLTALASPALAQTTNAARSPWAASVDFGPVWHHDPGYQPFLRNGAVPPVAGLAFGRDVARLGAWFTLAAEVAWRIENTEGRVRQAVDAQLVTNQFQAAVTLRADFWRWLAPYARLSGGVANLDVKLASESAQLRDDAWAPFGSAGAGVMLTGGSWFEGAGWTRGRVSFFVEGGYQLMASPTFRVEEPPPEDEREANDRIAPQALTLGTLNPSAAYLRIGVGLRF